MKKIYLIIALMTAVTVSANNDKKKVKVTTDKVVYEMIYNMDCNIEKKQALWLEYKKAQRNE